MSITSDTGPFSLVPEWVLDSAVSDRAVRLYALLGRYADDSGACWPTRRTLWTRLRCSERSLDAAVLELEELGALERRATYSDGVRRSNLWKIRRGTANPAPGVATSAGGGGAGIAVQNENQLNENQGRGARKRATAPPDDFSPTDAQCALALQHGIDVTAEVEGWLIWCRAEGRTYKDPVAGFSTWLRREVKYREARGPVPGHAVVNPGAGAGPVLPPARAETCPICESHVLACTCPKEEQ